MGRYWRKGMDVSVGRCLKQNMNFRRQDKERKWRLNQDQESVKPDMRQTIAGSWSLDREGQWADGRLSMYVSVGGA